MKDYDKRAAQRRARAECALVWADIRDQLMDRAMAYIDNLANKAITDGSKFDAHQVGKDAAEYGAQPWSLASAPAIEHQPAKKPRKR